LWSEVAKGAFTPNPAKPTKVCEQGGWHIFGSFNLQFWVVMLNAGFMSVLSFVYIEKPSIDARIVFKK
jgi:hypothetical protein